MIDPRYITNENVFSLDYSGEERRAALAKVHRELDELDACKSRKRQPLIAAFQFLLHCFRFNSMKATLQRTKTHCKEEEGR
jgi:hypothetical protein